MSLQDVRVALGGISQQRVSQLVQQGVLAVDRDANGAYQYDRAMVEAHCIERSTKHAKNDAQAEERRALREEAGERFKRQRQRERQREAERIAHLDSLQERGVLALERIVECLRQTR